MPYAPGPMPAVTPVFAQGAGGAAPASSGGGGGGVGIAQLANLGLKGYGLASKAGLVPSLGELSSSVFGPEVANALSYLNPGKLVGEGIAALGGPSAGAFASGLFSNVLGPGALAYGVAQLLAAIGDTGRTAVALGGGQSDNLGDLGQMFGSPSAQGKANDLYTAFTGARDWYDGGDPNQVGNMHAVFGSMDQRKMDPYYTMGYAPYSTPELAVNSGRQIARGRMGLPVPYEPLPDMMAGDASGANQRMLVDMMQGRSLPIFDAPDHHEMTSYQMFADRRAAMNGGEGSAYVPMEMDPFYAGLSERGKAWARSGLTDGAMFAYTSPEMVDSNPIFDVPITPVTASRDAAMHTTEVAGLPPFDPYRYGYGPAHDFTKTLLRWDEAGERA